MANSRAPEEVIAFLGPQLVGVVFNWLLLGILIVQVYIYSQNFPDDSWRIKSLVYSLIILECIQSGLLLNDTFQWAIYGWGVPGVTEKVETNWINVPIMSGIISTAVQLFFGWRIWVLSNSIIFTGIVSLGAVIQGSGAVAAGVLTEIGGSLASIHKYGKVAMTWLVTSVITDVVIAICMTYLLLRHKTQGITGSRINAAIRGLIRLTIETGTLTGIDLLHQGQCQIFEDISLTASMAILNLIFVSVFTHTGYFLAPAIIQTKLYSNSLLVIFNNRVALRNGAFSNTVVSSSSGVPRGARDLVFKVRTGTVLETQSSNIAEAELGNPAPVYELEPVIQAPAGIDKVISIAN